MNRFALVLVLLVLSLGCGAPDPDAIEVRSRSDYYGAEASLPVPPRQSLTVGDLLVTEVNAVDDDRTPTKLCVQATTTDEAIVRVRSFRGQECHLFVLEAKRPGRARVTFKARGTSAATDIDVVSAEP